MIAKHFVCPVFKADVYFIVDCSLKRLEQVMRNKFQLSCDFTKVLDKDAAGYLIPIRTSESASPEFVLWVETPTEDAGSLMHECVHLATSIFKFRNITEWIYDNQEMLSYYSQFWFESFIKLLKEQHAFNKKGKKSSA